MAFLEQIRQGLKKTRDSLFGQVAAVLQRGRDLGDEDYEALEAALLRADVGPQTTDKVLDGIKRRLADASFKGDAQGALRAEIECLLVGGSEVAPSGSKAEDQTPRGKHRSPQQARFRSLREELPVHRLRRTDRQAAS